MIRNMLLLSLLVSPTFLAAPVQAKPTYFECTEDFGFIQDGKDLALLNDPRTENLDKYLNALKGAKKKTLLETHKVMVDPDRAVASFAGSTGSSFYPTHISITRYLLERKFLLQISRKDLTFTVRAINLSRDGSTIRAWGRCQPIPLDPDNKI